MKTEIKPVFFKSAAELRKWLKKNHNKVNEFWIGYYKKGASKKGVTYIETVEECLCFGWIDGLVRGMDEEKYCQRLTPRRPNSIWSAVNIKKMEALIDSGQAEESGIKVYKMRDKKRAGLYSFENKEHKLGAAFGKKFKANKKAWEYYSNMPPWYRRTSAFWVISAKKEETKLKRLEELIRDSEAGRKIKSLNIGSTAKTKN
jgi:uncharacterized protein YdeI (YjbR/CyaY-like superfamily)